MAFQILNDLKDWEHDDDNKRTLGTDLLQGRPTVLLALALEGLKDPLRAELLELISDSCPKPIEHRLSRARHLFFEAGVFDSAYRLVDKHQEKAEEIADSIEPDELRRLFYYLVDTVLDRTTEVKPTIDITHLSFEEVLPVVNFRHAK